MSGGGEGEKKSNQKPFDPMATLKFELRKY